MLVTRVDTLLPSIQKVMQENAIRREVEASTNRDFGISTPKQLPHERLNEYKTTLAANIDSALKKNLVLEYSVVDASKSKEWNEKEGWWMDFEHHMRKTHKRNKYDVYKAQKLRDAGHDPKVAAHKYMSEHIDKDASCSDYIHDFVHSDNKMFSKDSKKKRINRALGACYAVKKKKGLAEADGGSAGVAMLKGADTASSGASAAGGSPPPTGIRGIPSAVASAVDDVSQGGIKGLANKVVTGVGIGAKSVGSAVGGAVGGASDYLNKKLDQAGGALTKAITPAPKPTNMERTLVGVKAERDADIAKGKGDKLPVNKPMDKTPLPPPPKLATKSIDQKLLPVKMQALKDKDFDNFKMPDYEKSGVHPSKDQPVRTQPSRPVTPTPPPKPVQPEHPYRGDKPMAPPPNPRARPSTDPDFGKAFAAARASGAKTFQWRNAAGKVGTYGTKVAVRRK